MSSGKVDLRDPEFVKGRLAGMIDLRDPELERDPEFVKERLAGIRQADSERTPAQRVRAAVFDFLASHMPLRKQVLFYTIRDDGRLEGNAAALYPYVKGRKVIAARRLPHPGGYQLKMFWEIMRSRVIVTDDYVRYLRYFPLRKDQKVVQLWHACGAFKKFGRFGTNLEESVDLATHAQYNLVCVSGEEVRDVYADSFGIDRKKVRALGAPRTDIFFDKGRQAQIRQEVCSRYPQLRGKRVILYAPTFRDTSSDRTVFRPQLDFDRLSAELPEDMMFVVRPHPIMTAPVISGKYDKVLEIRDIPTNDLMFVSDLLVTDYSSVIFEYSLLKKPILFFCYDLESYNRGFYLKYPDDLPGDVITDQNQLKERLCSDSWNKMGSGYEEFVSRYMSACDGRSSRRIAGIINRYMSGH